MRQKMTEAEFTEAIDPGLSFDTGQEYEEVARVGCSISDNAALMVGYLLACGSSRAGLELNLRLLDVLRQERPTAIILATIPVIEALLKKTTSDS